ncbi:unnamed protein product [Prorocentrum cordatum]|uniref:Uncharacterized protein n=1 Tax=Prorocentrum cordatum TaxID=2364126 RepID=A0ABN9TE48_9DINO|nr:unnamed protein product [Polarella glacialis]
MADQIKEMQRSDPVAKESSGMPTARLLERTFPTRRSTTSASSAVSSRSTSPGPAESGARLEYKEGQDLVKFIKLGQRKKSQGWKSSWETYCSSKPINGKPKHDPAQHDSSFLEGFFDFVAMMALSRGGVAGGMGAMGMGGWGMGAQGGPPHKRGPGASSGDLAKDRRGPPPGTASATPTLVASTTRDAPIWTLSTCLCSPTAFRTIDLQPDCVGGGSMGGCGGGAGVGPMHPMVAQIKAYQRLGEQQKEA